MYRVCVFSFTAVWGHIGTHKEDVYKVVTLEDFLALTLFYQTHPELEDFVFSLQLISVSELN